MRPPILNRKDYSSPSVFLPENLLREARRQKRLTEARVPGICVLDPDGDILRYLQAEGRARRYDGWACYHSELSEFELGGAPAGIVGSAVGAPYAVLLAEQLFASGCEFLLSVTSAGQLKYVQTPPYFVLIDKALRDEGTSYHYLPESEFSEAEPRLLARLRAALDQFEPSILCGPTWTTDAPYRETSAAIEAHTSDGLLAVEMEAAALYAFSRALRKPVVCFAHVTNTMAQTEGEFEKGDSGGAADAISLLSAVARWWRSNGTG